MKKLISIALILCMILSLSIPAAAASTAQVDITYRAIKLVLDGKEITPCDEKGNTVAPFIMNSNGTTYLPLRAVAQALGLNVRWVAETSTVELTSGGSVVTGAGAPSDKKASENATITYRDIKVTLDGEPLKLVNAAGETVEPFIMGGSTYLPLRIIGESLGLEISWDAKTSTVGLAQPEGEWIQTDEKYTSYDERGNVVDGCSYSYTYHPNGEMAEYSYKAFDGSYSLFKYDENGRTIRQEDDFGSGLAIGEYEYDDAGRETYSKYATPDDGYSSETWTTYDAEGREASQRFLVHYEGGVNDYSVTYTYKGNTRIGTYSYADGSTSDDELITYSYDDQGRIIKMVTEYGDYGYTEEFKYDQWGNNCYSSYVTTDGFYSTYSNQYNAKGHLLREESEYCWGDEVTKNVYVYTRNDNGSIACMEYSSYVDGVMEFGWTRSNNYDKNGLYLGYTYTAMGDISESVVISYGSNGLPASAVMENNRGKTVFSFTFDGNGNVVKAVGACDDGGSEVYEFTYTLMK